MLAQGWIQRGEGAAGRQCCMLPQRDWKPVVVSCPWEDSTNMSGRIKQRLRRE